MGRREQKRESAKIAGKLPFGGSFFFSKKEQKLSSPHFLVNVFFSTYTHLFLQSCICWKHYKNSVLSRAQLLCIPHTKNPPFKAPSQNGTFQTKSAILGFPLVPAEAPIFVVFGDSVWPQKSDMYQKQIVSTKMCLLTFRTQIVFANFSKSCQFRKKNILFVHNHPKHFFSISSSCFWYFLFPKQKKMYFSITLFWHPDNLPKNIFAPLHTTCDRHKKSWTSFWRSAWTGFWLRNQKTWTSFWHYGIYIYGTSQVLGPHFTQKSHF